MSTSEQKLYRKCGSPGYVSPELLRGEGYDCKTDIFSAGVIFAELITGRVFFKGSTIESIFQKIIDYELTFPKEVWKHVSKEAFDLVKQMLAEDPAQRITAE